MGSLQPCVREQNRLFSPVLEEKEHNSLTLLPLNSLNKAVTSSFMGFLNAT